MQTDRLHRLLSRVVGYVVLLYGLLTIAGSLVRQLQSHRHHDLDALLVSIPVLVGISYVYLANLLLRLKYNAWLTATVLSSAFSLLNLGELIVHEERSDTILGSVRIALPLVVLLLLIISRRMFRVRSDARTFTEAVRISVVVLLIAFLYGVVGFTLLDTHDFHQEIGLQTAVHQTLDQFGLTTKLVTPHTRRAVLFIDSLSAVSVGAVAYVALSFFQPLRMRLTNQTKQRERTKQLLAKYTSDIDDYFKLWPHDKQYYFDPTEHAGLAYHVSRGIALVVGDPFGDPKRFKSLLNSFDELCFVNDWAPSFIHVGSTHSKLYKSRGYTLQKIGEEAVLDIAAFTAQKPSKYFRQIRNRFTRLGYSLELVQPPHSPALLSRLRTISDDWLTAPGRSERGFMMGYHTDEYLQNGPIAIVRDEAQQIQGFINLVPTYKPGTANYDLLRCAQTAPGNCNDFLLLELISLLREQDVHTLNLGLCPLAGMDEKSTDASLIDTAIRFVYANGDRVYSFSGLKRFKTKYEPDWDDRYIAYRGGIPGFSRTVTALNRAMKVKNKHP